MTLPAAAWTALSLEVPPDAVDLLATFLVEEGARGVLLDEPDPSGRPASPGRVRVEAHFQSADAPDVATALACYVRELGALVPGLAGTTIERRPVPDLDWQAAFAAHHRPRLVGSRLVVAPPWDAPRAAGREVIVVDPGQAFGTGQHATTRGCLEEIEAAVEAGLASGLDVGTGSGVLAVAMRRLGMRPVVATDVDPAVVPVARHTCVANAAADVLLLVGHAGAVRGRFDLVVANILADTLVTEAATLAARVATGGRLVLSGLLDTQVDAVAAAYPRWHVAHVAAEDEWRTLRLERAG